MNTIRPRVGLMDAMHSYNNALVYIGIAQTVVFILQLFRIRLPSLQAASNCGRSVQAIR
jgi:hypothetical protein